MSIKNDVIFSRKIGDLVFYNQPWGNLPLEGRITSIFASTTQGLFSVKRKETYFINGAIFIDSNKCFDEIDGHKNNKIIYKESFRFYVNQRIPSITNFGTTKDIVESLIITLNKNGLTKYIKFKRITEFFEEEKVKNIIERIKFSEGLQG